MHPQNSETALPHSSIQSNMFETENSTLPAFQINHKFPRNIELRSEQGHGRAHPTESAVNDDGEGRLIKEFTPSSRNKKYKYHGIQSNESLQSGSSETTIE